MKQLPVSALDRLLKGDKPIYVINTSCLPTGDKGTLLVHFFDGTRREYFKMPPTFIPMAISDVIPKKSLGNSRDFKQLLIKGMLTLVDPDEAASYMETEDALEEYEDLTLSEMSMRASNGRIESEARAAKKVQNRFTPSGAPEYPTEFQPPEDEAQDIDPVSNRVKALIHDSISGTRTPKEVKQELRRQASNFSAADFHYVRANARDESLITWATKSLETASAPKPAKKLSGAALKSSERRKVARPAAHDDDDDAPEDPAEVAEAARHQIIGAGSSLGR